LLRDGSQMQSVHDRNIEGLFSQQTWLEILSAVGFEVRLVPRPIGDRESDQVFLCARP
jgi:hypothetical protein